jgi:hypothetical protein
VIVLSLVLVIVAAVTLVLGVFQDGLTLIYVSIGTCLAAMVLLGIGVLMRRREDTQAAPSPAGYGPGAGTDQPTAPHRDEEVRVHEADDASQARPAKKAVVKKVSATPTVPGRESTAEQPAVGGPATAATGAAATSAAASASEGDDEEKDARTEVAPTPAAAPRKVAAKKATVKKATADRSPAEQAVTSDPEAPAVASDAPAAAATARKVTAKKATVKKATAKKATAKKATAKKATAKKATAKKATAKKATAKKATAKKASGSGSAGLPELKGLGPAKKKALLAEFGSVENIRSADVSELAAVKGVGPGLAAQLKRELGG